MRKGLSYCGAAAIAAAGMLYLAAGYASNHPHALISRCLIAGYVLSTPDFLSSTIGTGPHDDGSTCPDGETQLTEHSQTKRCLAGSDDDAEQFRLPGRIIIEEEAARAPTTFPLVFEESEEPALLVPQARDQSAPRTMPFACDDVESPDRMPYSTDNEFRSEASPVVSIWNRFFGCAAPTCNADHGPMPARPATESMNPEDLLLHSGSQADQESKSSGPKRSQSYKLTLDTIEKDMLRPYPPVDTLDLRPSDMKPYRYQPLPF